MCSSHSIALDSQPQSAGKLYPIVSEVIRSVSRACLKRRMSSAGKFSNETRNRGLTPDSDKLSGREETDCRPFHGEEDAYCWRDACNGSRTCPHRVTFIHVLDSSNESRDTSIGRFDSNAVCWRKRKDGSTFSKEDSLMSYFIQAAPCRSRPITVTSLSVRELYESLTRCIISL